MAGFWHRVFTSMFVCMVMVWFFGGREGEGREGEGREGGRGKGGREGGRGKEYSCFHLVEVHCLVAV